MKLATVAKRSTALLLLAALAACAGGGAGGSSAIPNRVLPEQRGVQPEKGGILARIVGVGDSLTAGYQAGGFLGATNVKNPWDSTPPYTIVPPNQENGWWADLDEQASGLPLDTVIGSMYDPATSPLPLIAGPGLNNQVVASSTTVVTTLRAPTVNPCTAYNNFNARGYVLGGLPTVRLNPHSTMVRDVGVPGITLHEANVLWEPQTDTCEELPGVPGLLNQVVAGETSTFWPVLGDFAYMGQNLSEVKAAASLHPTLATVWLGANDVLKYMGSGGQFVGGDNTVGQVASDLRTTIRTLQYSGAHVVVANLPDILLTPYFERVDIPTNTNVCQYNGYAYCVMVNFGLPTTVAGPIVTQLSATYHLSTTTCTPASTSAPCGYLTLPGLLLTLSTYLSTGKVANLDPHGPGSGLGANYITPAFAAKVQGLNDTVNAGIGAAVQSTYVPLVDVQKIFAGIASAKKGNPYFEQVRNINRPLCCTLTYSQPGVSGGLVSFDEIHPSNTGYAIIAYYFIQAINERWNLHVRQIDVRAAYNGKRCSKYCFPDPYAPH